MLFQSTRSKGEGVPSSVAMKQGLAEDGGLFVPESFPRFSPEEIYGMKEMSYPQRAKAVIGKYLTDFTEEELDACIEKAYCTRRFETDSIAPVYKLNDQVYFLELWHGPTCAFKDMALQILPHFLTTAIRKTGEDKTLLILTATSGDTGKAALEGFRDAEGTKIAVFYPQDGVSAIQKLQMTTQEGNNVTVSGINGNFDDAQTGVKEIFTDAAYKEALLEKGYKLSSANSINWGRLVPQIVYYFSAYADMLAADEIEEGELVNFVVPTGNFGDILAGYYAKKMGLPVHRLICASNRNNVLTEFINTGVYNKNRDFYTTSSPSMDILISSNLERFLYDITGQDFARVRSWMSDLSQKGSYEVPDITKERLREELYGGFCSEADTLFTIKDTFAAYGYLMDPHTAVGKNVYDQYRFETGDVTKSVVLSTASPYKFNQSVLEALSGEGALRGKTEFQLLQDLSELSLLPIPQSLDSLRRKEVRFPGTVAKTGLKDFINSFLQ